MPDYRSMQQEAIQRAIEMQRRAQKPPENNNMPHVETSSSPNVSNEKPAEIKKDSFFDIIFKDNEKTLLLILLLILSSEKSDIALLFALLYISL
jgi:hypothetical protein